MAQIKNIREVAESLKEEIQKGDVHTKDATINVILREFVMSKVSCDEMCNMNMIVELLRPQLEVSKKDIEPVIIMGLYHHSDHVGSLSTFIRKDN